MTRPGDPSSDVLAAVDLGSNSFHMVVARWSHGQLVILDRLRETVRLAAGLDEQGRIDRDAIARALACLERFGQRLRDVQAQRVRVVGTNTLRKAKRKGSFLDRAREVLGHPIEIISGVEEARLIYQGVARTTPDSPGHRLVIDIGGGSTELIIGEGLATRRLESLYIGCVGMMSAHFADGEITEKRLKRARTAAELEFEPVVARFRRSEWDTAFGASGTVRAVVDVLAARGGPSGVVTRDGVESLREACVRAGSVARIDLEGLSQDRREILPGGLVILEAAFDMLGIETLNIADGALREGLLYDLLGRLTDEDARVRSVRAMERRFHVDSAQADRVESTVLALLRQVRDPWGLDEPLAELALRWAARLHEVGLDIAHAQYHRHGAYLLEHADMPGFPREEQRLLAALVGAHRRKLDLLPCESLVPPWHLKAAFLIVLLRLAVLLHRGRGPEALPRLDLAVKGRSIEMGLPKGWLGDHPLTEADLEQEADWLRAAGFRLRVG